MESWFRAGASVVGIGSALIHPSLVEKKDWQLLRDNTSALLNQVTEIRKTFA
jgi:2-keto-3-deoxy-6-phosphogluconate aldolase